MKKIIKMITGFLKEFFIDGLTGMAQGLFATLIIGTIVTQIAAWIPASLGIGGYLMVMGKIAMLLTGAGIGCGVALKLKATPLVTLSASVSGFLSAYAAKILAGSVLTDGVMQFTPPGEPLGAFLGAITAIYVGRLISGKTKLDIILTPFTCILTGSTVGLILGSPISAFMIKVGELIAFGTQQAPFLMGIIVSVLMGIALTLPISSAAIGVILGLSGISAGAATVGCCANMVGFAVASFKDNKWNGLLAQGLGTSMLQMGNIVKKPTIWIPAIAASIVTGPLATCVFHFENNATGSGMGTAGLVGPINAYNTMVASGVNPLWVLVQILLLCFVIPGFVAWGTAWAMRKMHLLKDGDMKLD